MNLFAFQKVYAYRNSSDDSSEIAEIKANYGALVAFCDQQLGRLIDYIDANRMWDDTAIIILMLGGLVGQIANAIFQ